MNSEFAEQLLIDNPVFSTLPHTMVEVLRVARDEQSSADELARVLMKDPALTANILRIVNAPFYGMGRQVSSLAQAVMTIGTRQVMALALSSSVYQMTRDWESMLDKIRFWRHSLETAIAARMVAQKAGYPHAEEAFVAGLLHDIGLLLLERSRTEQFNRVWSQAEREGRLTVLEDATWGTNHAEVGQFLMDHWQLPESICAAIGSHHSSFSGKPKDATDRLSQIVCLGHMISKFAVSSERRINADMLITKEELRSNLKIPAGELLSIEKQLASQTLEEAAFLEFEIGSVDDIMLEVNQLLFDQYVMVEDLLREVRFMKTQISENDRRQQNLESLRTNTVLFTKFIKDAAETASRQTESLRKDIASSGLVDPGAELDSTLLAIIGSNEKVQSMADKLRLLGSIDDFEQADVDHLGAMERLIKDQFEGPDDPSQ